jgi:alpha-galactosidase
MIAPQVYGADDAAKSKNWCDEILPPCPVSFNYGGKSSKDLLTEWTREQNSEQLDKDRTKITTQWTDPKTGLRVHLQTIRYLDFPAVEWLPHFENTGTKDTPIIENVYSLDMSIESPLGHTWIYRLHKTNGAPSNPTDFEMSVVHFKRGQVEKMGGGAGRSSNKDLPFFKIETERGSMVAAVGWSGQWQTVLRTDKYAKLHMTSGLEKTHFLLHPGEKVRCPRMLLLLWEGDTYESNAQFRQLIYKHYTAVRNGQKRLPAIYCNTCFTRGGGWLNECNAENQISLINAYGPLGLEALLTDAGWFEGGWPAGAGNWTPRKDAYPEGMRPVAAAAKKQKMIYGLWFEPERVMPGTWLHKNRPELLLKTKTPHPRGFLLNFGLPEVQDYFFNIVKGFMDLPGFRVYRQDFNNNPLQYWLDTDPPDRQGITEMKYIEGLYAYWDRIAETWPDSLRIECSSGGRRIDLETVMRMHIHQKTDYWFDEEVDQATNFSLSQYLPNNVFMTPTRVLQDYAFHSALASTLCLGWIADKPGFDTKQAKEFLERYRRVRHLLIGAWYPLFPYSRIRNQWMGSQYHRPDLNEGMILVFRRPLSPYRTAELIFRGLDAEATYQLIHENTGKKELIEGSQLMENYEITLPQKRQSILIVYRKVKD